MPPAQAPSSLASSFATKLRDAAAQPQDGPTTVADDQQATAATFSQLHEVCAKLRKSLGEAIESKKKIPLGAAARMLLADSSLSLVELRDVNRTVWELLASFKARSAGANLEVDTADLKLQNLQYEKNYFLREVRVRVGSRTDRQPRSAAVHAPRVLLRPPRHRARR